MSNPRSPRPTRSAVRSAGARKMYKEKMFAVVADGFKPILFDYKIQAQRHLGNMIVDRLFRVVEVEVREVARPGDGSTRRKGGKK